MSTEVISFLECERIGGSTSCWKEMKQLDMLLQVKLLKYFQEFRIKVKFWFWDMDGLRCPHVFRCSHVRLGLAADVVPGF